MFLAFLRLKTIFNCVISGDDIVDPDGEDDEEDDYEDVFEDENEDGHDFIA